MLGWDCPAFHSMHNSLIPFFPTAGATRLHRGVIFRQPQRPPRPHRPPNAGDVYVLTISNPLINSDATDHALVAAQATGDPQPEVPPVTASDDAEVLQASIKAGSVAQIVVAVIAVIGLIYLLKLVLVTTLASLLLAFILEPLVSALVRIRVPQAAGSLLLAVALVALAGVLTSFFYGRAVDSPATAKIFRENPLHPGRLAGTNQPDRREHARSVIASPKTGKAPLAVEVQEAPGLSRIISAGRGTLGEVVLAVTFVPFLVYFMLTWKDHAHSTTVKLSPKEHRLAAHRTVARISAMIRSFIVGNVLVGLINALVSTIVFWQLGIPYFYFLGVISGFASLVPNLGVFLALLPPLAGGMGTVQQERSRHPS